MKFTISLMVIAFFFGAGCQASPTPDDKIEFRGPYPTPGPVTVPDGSGGTMTVTAYPGLVVVHTRTISPFQTPSQMFAKVGGTIVGQIPSVGFYLVQVDAGHEADFISSVVADLTVVDAYPDFPLGTLSTTVIDQCIDHGRDVRQVLNRCNKVATPPGDAPTCLDVTFLDDTFHISDVINMLTVETTFPDEEHYINISLGPKETAGDGTERDWSEQSPAMQAAMEHRLEKWLTAIASTIMQLPDDMKDGLVVTMAAGNNNMPIDGILSRMEWIPGVGTALRDNMVMVATALPPSGGWPGTNGSGSTSGEVVFVDNTESASGTSFAAPAVLALIRNVASETGLSPTDVLKAAKQAAAAHRAHLLTEAALRAYARGQTGGLCDLRSVAGGDEPDSQTFELGTNTGSVEFLYDAYSIPDRIVVTHDGVVLHDTGCTSGGATVAIPISGGSTSITVSVTPNCSGTTGTAWEYVVGCPSRVRTCDAP